MMNRLARTSGPLLIEAIMLILIGPAVLARGADERQLDIAPGLAAKGGLVVHLGCGDGRSMVEQARGGNFVVHGLTADESELERAERVISNENT